MDAHSRRPVVRVIGIVLAMLAAVAAVGGSAAATMTDAPAGVGDKVDPTVSAAFDSQEEATFWVVLRDRANLSRAATMKDDNGRGRFVVDELHGVADRSQAGLRGLLRSRKATFTPFWIANAISVTGDRTLMAEIARRPEVAQILAPVVHHVPEPAPRDAELAANAIAWGITNIQADRVWSELGVRGEGIVVANIDTGVDFDHPALVGKYRGNLGGGTFDHNYNWFDPSPSARRRHRATTTTTARTRWGPWSATTAQGNQIGVAPGAQFIAAKGCETSRLLGRRLAGVGPVDLGPDRPRAAPTRDRICAPTS